jgi:small subunit ribosomal protein S17e
LYEHHLARFGPKSPKIAIRGQKTSPCCYEKFIKKKGPLLIYKMGRIKTAKIKRTTEKLMGLHKAEFKKDFSENKTLLSGFAEIRSKKVRNTIAGYVTRLVKAKE